MTILLLDKDIITLANGWDNFSWHEKDLHTRSKQSVCLLELLTDLLLLTSLGAVEVVAELQAPMFARNLPVTVWVADQHTPDTTEPGA